MTDPAPIIRRFRVICIAEGISWAFLIGGMIIKYGMGRPEAVRLPGMIHGGLVIAYAITAVPLFTRLKWDAERLYGVVAAGVVPFGTFLLERKWLR